MNTTTLLLVRHGESIANRNDLFAGHYDPDLHENGIMQAKLTALYLKNNYVVDNIYSSDLKRAYYTAKAIAELIGKDIIKSKNLREISAGEWEGIPFNEIAVRYPREFDVWLHDIGNSRCPKGESVREMGERFYNELKRIASENEGKTVVVATHSTPIRAMQSIVQTGGLDDMNNISWVSNASVSVLEYNSENWCFKEISHDAHLGKIKTDVPVNV